MMRICAVLLAALSACHASRDTAMAQVIKDVEGICLQNKKDGESEIADWGKYNRDQQSQITELKNANKKYEEEIEKQKREMTKQKAIFEAKKSEEEEAQKNLDGLSMEAEGLEAQAKKNKEETNAKCDDLQTTLDAITSAMQKIQDAAPTAMIDVNNALTLADALGDRKVVKSFLQQRGNPPSHTTKADWKSGGVLGLLGDLKNDFTSKHKACQTALANIDANKEVAKKANEDSVKSQTEIRDAAKAAKEAAAKAEENAKNEKETAEGNLDKSKDELEKTENNLKDQSRMFSESQADRQRVKEGCNEVLKILRADADIAVKDVQTTFIQMSEPIQQVAATLKAQSLRYHDVDVGHVADLLAVGQAPADNTYKGSQSEETKCVFEETVVPMIQKMLKKINDEKREAINDWGYCKEQLSNLGVDMSKRANEIKALEDRISTLQTQEDDAKQAAENAETRLGELDEEVNTLKADRRANQNENNECIADATKAVDALDRALAAVAQYFGSFEKEGHADWAKDHSRSSGQKVIDDILKETQSKYADMKVKCTQLEASQKTDFNQEMQDKSVEKAGEETNFANNKEKHSMAVAEKAKKSDQKDATSDQLELTESTSKDFGHACGNMEVLNKYFKKESKPELGEDAWFKNGEHDGKTAPGKTMVARMAALQGLFDARQQGFDDERAALIKGMEALRAGCETMKTKRDDARAKGAKAMQDGSQSLKDQQEKLAKAQR